MHKQYYTLCCKNNCCKQDNTQWNNFLGCQKHTKDSRNRTCIAGPSKGFVQNLKDKFVNLQQEQLQFAKKPVKKKQKDYYCLMLRKINNLDKKLQNLEHLFTSHLNHTPNDVFNSNDNEPLFDYMDFYDSVRSLVDLANRLKEDILCKQCDNHMPNRNSLHLNDRIQVLDSELQNLYTHLEQLQNCSNEIKDEKQFYVQNWQDSPFRGGPKVENKRCSDFKEFRKINKNKRTIPEKYNEDCRNNSSSHCIEYCYEADEAMRAGYSPVSCQCSRCNLNATICSMSPGNRRCSPKIFEHCQGESIAKNSDCSCVLCIKERKKANKFKNNCLWVSQSISSCSCEICINNNRKSCSQNCNSARIKIIKPVKKGENEEDFFGELQISYHELEPSRIDKKKKQRNKRRNQNINEDDQDTNFETTYFQDIGPGSKGPNSMTASHNNSRDSSILEQTQGKFTKNKYSNTFSPSNKQETEDVNNVVYYELTPDLNIITKRKNNGHVLSRAQEHHQGRDQNAKKNKTKVANKKYEKINHSNRLHTVNFNLREEDPSNKFFKKVVREKRTSHDYHVNDQSSSENDFMKNLYQADKQIHTDQKKTNKTNGAAGKHLHIKLRNKKEFGEGMTVEENVIRSPELQYKYTNKSSHHYHRKHGGFCHFQSGKDVKEPSSNKRYPNIYPYQGEISESDSFETVEEYESDSDSCSSQYKLFFCNDPNCVEKLDSDELIMLMNKTDLKYCGGNPYKLSISENVKDLKSDICEKCTIKEKTISVTPHKTKNRNNNGKAKILFKKEVVECSKCKNKNNDKSSQIIKTNIEYVDSESENERSERQEITNKSSNIKNRGSNIESSNQERENKNKKDIKNQESNQLLARKDSRLQSTTLTNVGNNRKQRDISIVGSNDKKNTIVACSKIDQSTSFKTILKANNSNSTKALELPGFGNLININIERGSYSLNQQPDIINTKKDTDGATLPETKVLENKNMNSCPIADTKHDKIIGVCNVYSSNIPVHNIDDRRSRNISDQFKTQSSHQPNNKSISAMDLEINSGKEIKEITIVKSEICTKAVNNDSYSSKIKDDKKNLFNKDQIVFHAATVTSGMTDGKDDKRLQSKKNHVNIKKDMSLNYVTEEISGNVLHNTQDPDSHYIYEKKYDHSSNTLPASKKNIVKPRVSTSRIKRSRLKYNKKFGSSLSKVSSAHSIVVQQAKLYPSDDFPSKRSNVFNPGRRISKLSKRRQNGYPRMCSLKENSLSGIIKPQMKIVVQESYQNDLKIPTNNCYNPRYKVASISNYLSSTVVSESSYSTLNWEKVANKLKEDDKYFNNIV